MVYSESANLIFLASLMMLLITPIQGPWTMFGNKDPCADDEGNKEKDATSSNNSFQRIFGSKRESSSPEKKLEERAYYLFNRGKFDKALICFDKAIKLFPYDAKFHRDRGICHLRLNKFDMAVLDFTNFLNLEANSVKGRILLAETFFETGKLYDALENLKKAFKVPHIADNEREEANSLRTKVHFELQKKLAQGWPQEGNKIFLSSDPCAYSIRPEDVGEESEVTPDALNSLGNGLFSEEAYEEAIRCYTQAIIQKSDEAKYFRNRGFCLRKTYVTHKALEDIRKSLELEPQSARGQFLLAQLLFDSDDYHEAVQILQQVLADSNLSNDEEILIKNLLKKALQYSRDPCADDEEDDEADTWWSQERRPDVQAKIDERANLLFTLGKFDEALICYNKAIKKMPLEPKYYRKRGFCHAKLGMLDSAIADYEQLLKLLSTRAITKDKLLLINALLDAERYYEAYENLEQALEDISLPLHEKGEVVMLQKSAVRRIEEKMEQNWLQEGDHIDSNRGTEMEMSDPCVENYVTDGLSEPEVTPDELNERGNILFAAGDYRNALRCYDKAIEQNSNEMKYYRNRAWCYKRLDDLDMAYADLQVVSNLQALNVRARFLLAGILFYSEKFDEASEHCKQVLLEKSISKEEEVPFKFMLKKIIHDKLERCVESAEEEQRRWFPNARFKILGSPRERAERYFRADKYEEALSCYNLAIKQDDMNPYLYKRRGFCHSKLGHLDSAVADYELVKILKHDSESTEERLLLIRALYDAKRYCEAYENIERAFEIRRLAPSEEVELVSLQDEIVHHLEEKLEKSWVQEVVDKDTETKLTVSDAANDGTPPPDENIQEDNPQTVAEPSYELNEKGNLHFAAENYLEALHWYTKAIESNPKERRYYRNRAWCHRKLNDRRMALADLEASSHPLEAVDVKTLYLKALIMIEFNMYEKTTENLKQILEENKNLSKEEEIIVKYSLKKVLQYRQEMCDEEADEEMKQWFPNSMSSVVGSPAKKASEFLAQKKYKEAISCYNKAIKIDPENAIFYKNRGICYSNLGELDSALANFEKMVEVQPHLRVAIGERFLLAKAQYDSGRFVDAYKNVKQCLRDNAHKSDWAKFDETELVSLQQRALSKIEENMTNTWSQEGEVIIREEDIITDEKRLIMEGGGNSFDELELYVLQENSNDRRDPCAEETPLSTPDDTILNARGNGFFAQNRYREACQCYSKAIEMNRTKAMYYRNRGVCFKNLNLADSAKQDIEAAMKWEPKNARNVFLLAQILSYFDEDHRILSFIGEGWKDVDFTDEEAVLWDILHEKALQKQEEWLKNERIRKGKESMPYEDKKKKPDRSNGRGLTSIRIQD